MKLWKRVVKVCEDHMFSIIPMLFGGLIGGLLMSIKNLKSGATDIPSVLLSIGLGLTVVLGVYIGFVLLVTRKDKS